MYLHVIREEALADFRHQQLLYVQHGLKDRPDPPAFLANIEEE